MVIGSKMEITDGGGSVFMQMRSAGRRATPSGFSGGGTGLGRRRPPDFFPLVFPAAVGCGVWVIIDQGCATAA